MLAAARAIAAEQIVEGMIFAHDDNQMLDRRARVFPPSALVVVCEGGGNRLAKDRSGDDRCVHAARQAVTLLVHKFL